MPTNYPSIIQADELIARAQIQRIIIIDASAGPGAYDRYLAQHLAGALYTDLNTDLASIPEDPANGGRHPLPSIQDFAMVLGKLGLSAQSHVIIYDDRGGSNAAARFWWMLRAAGHKKVQVLNGGMAAALKKGWPVRAGAETAAPAQPYSFTHWQLPTATMAEVESAASSNDFVVIDVRDKDRFSGLTEPIDLVAGHIPGAVNMPFAANLDKDGLFYLPEP